MKQRRLIALLGGTAAWPFVARAQRSSKIFRVGCAYIADPASFHSLQEAFVSALHVLGYVEGQHIVYDLRYAEDDPARLPALINELISLKPDVLAGIEAIARVMLSKTSTIPIVMFIGRPRRCWASQKPFASWRERDWRFYGAGELGPKQLELLRVILPTLTRVGHLFDTNVPSSKLEKQLTREAARN